MAGFNWGLASVGFLAGLSDAIATHAERRRKEELQALQLAKDSGKYEIVPATPDQLQLAPFGQRLFGGTPYAPIPGAGEEQVPVLPLGRGGITLRPVQMADTLPAEFLKPLGLDAPEFKSYLSKTPAGNVVKQVADIKKFLMTQENLDDRMMIGQRATQYQSLLNTLQSASEKPMTEQQQAALKVAQDFLMQGNYRDERFMQLAQDIVRRATTPQMVPMPEQPGVVVPPAEAAKEQHRLRTEQRQREENAEQRRQYEGREERYQNQFRMQQQEMAASRFNAAMNKATERLGTIDPEMLDDAQRASFDQALETLNQAETIADITKAEKLLLRIPAGYVIGPTGERVVASKGAGGRQAAAMAKLGITPEVAQEFRAAGEDPTRAGATRVNEMIGKAEDRKVARWQRLEDARLTAAEDRPLTPAQALLYSHPDKHGHPNTGDRPSEAVAEGYRLLDQQGQTTIQIIEEAKDIEKRLKFLLLGGKDVYGEFTKKPGDDFAGILQAEPGILNRIAEKGVLTASDLGQNDIGRAAAEYRRKIAQFRGLFSRGIGGQKGQVTDQDARDAEGAFPVAYAGGLSLPDTRKYGEQIFRQNAAFYDRIKARAFGQPVKEPGGTEILDLIKKNLNP